MQSITRVIVIFLTLILLPLTGCRYEYAGRVEAIEPLIAEQPDSALAALNRIPSEKLTERDRAIYNVLLTQAIDKTSEDYLTDDSIVAEALNYFETHGDDPHYEMLANYYVGQIALTNKDYGKAICHLQQCEELAESLEDHLNLALACRTLSDLYRLTKIFLNLRRYINSCIYIPCSVFSSGCIAFFCNRSSDKIYNIKYRIIQLIKESNSVRTEEYLSYIS